jgi:uncharacterized protein (TIGR02996 family)
MSKRQIPAEDKRLLRDMVRLLFGPALEAGFDLRNPTERAVAADWLEDHGDPQAAGWLRQLDEQCRARGQARKAEAGSELS